MYSLTSALAWDNDLRSTLPQINGDDSRIFSSARPPARKSPTTAGM